VGHTLEGLVHPTCVATLPFFAVWLSALAAAVLSAFDDFGVGEHLAGGRGRARRGLAGVLRCHGRIPPPCASGPSDSGPRRPRRYSAQQLTTHLAKLDGQEGNLLDLAADADIPKAKLKERLLRISTQRTQIQADMADLTVGLQAGAKVIEAALLLLEQPDELYRKLDHQGRRSLNQAIFNELYIYRDEVIDDDLRAPYAAFVEVHRGSTVIHAERQDNSPTLAGHGNTRGRWTVTCHRPLWGTEALLLETALSGGGSSKDALVEVMGIEPTTSSMRPKRSSQLSYTPRG
jgi:hypothetical protein